MLPKHLTPFVAAACALAGFTAWGQSINVTDRETLDRMKEEAETGAKRYESRLQGQDLTAEKRMFGSDEKAAAARQGVLDYLGIKPEEGTLYVFASTSMPRSMIEAYLNEGVWSGAIVVVRGIPEGMRLKQWVADWYKPFQVDGKPTATLTIDPVLFDQYAVNQVPTIIWDEAPQRLIGGDCDTADVMRSSGKDKPALKLATCKPFASQDIYRIIGAVTVDYALEEFEKSGAKSAGARLERMRSFFVHGSPKEQQDFGAEWTEYLSKDGQERLRGIQDGLARFEQAQIQRMAPLFAEDAAESRRFGLQHYPTPRLDGNERR